jgi:hypothetical protein
MWILYGDVCTQVIRVMCGVCMDTSLHNISEKYVDSLWRLLYKRYQTDIWNLYGVICTPDIRLMCEDSMETSVHKLSD